MTATTDQHTTVRLPRPVYIALRQKLIGEGKSFSAWTREQAEAYLKGNGRKL